MRKQCVPGVSPPPSQTPGYEAKEEEEEEEIFGCLATFWFGTFAMHFSATGHVVHHENT